MLNEPHGLGVPSQEPPVPNWEPDLARCSWRAHVNLSTFLHSINVLYYYIVPQVLNKKRCLKYGTNIHLLSGVHLFLRNS